MTSYRITQWRVTVSLDSAEEGASPDAKVATVSATDWAGAVRHALHELDMALVSGKANITAVRL